MNKKINMTQQNERARAIRRHNERLNTDGYLYSSRVAAILVVLVLIGIGYVLLRNNTEAVGRKIRKLELDEGELDRRLAVEQYNWELLITPASLETELRKHSLAMGFPRPDQVVTVRHVDDWLERHQRAESAFLTVAGADGDHLR